ncbi:MAG: hypothetical protein ACOC2A_01155, partial [Halanaeroarchaeum sp.]
MDDATVADDDASSIDDSPLSPEVLGLAAGVVDVPVFAYVASWCSRTWSSARSSVVSRAPASRYFYPTRSDAARTIPEPSPGTRGVPT